MALRYALELVRAIDPAVACPPSPTLQVRVFPHELVSTTPYETMRITTSVLPLAATLALTTPPAPLTAQRYDVLITGGTVVDGIRGPVRKPVS